MTIEMTYTTKQGYTEQVKQTGNRFYFLCRFMGRWLPVKKSLVTFTEVVEVNELAVKEAVEIAVTEYAKVIVEKMIVKNGQRQAKAMVNKIGFDEFEKIIAKSWSEHKANIEHGLCYAVKLIELEVSSAKA